jgi:transposase
MVEHVGGFFDTERTLVRERLCFPPDAAPSQIAPTRWSLRTIQRTFPFLAQFLHLASVWKRLRRYGIRLRRGRPQRYSPDPAYRSKEAHLLSILQEVALSHGRKIAVFVDEMGYQSWPDPSSDWCSQAPAPIPRADRKRSSLKQWRVIGALHASTGQVLQLTNQVIGRKGVCDFLCQIHQAYKQVDTIYVIWDNWPVHAHQEVFDTLKLLPRIELVWLPTYSPWLNPIEKLWRKFRQDILYLHRFADDLPQFQHRVQEFFAQFAGGSQDLLRYVGLSGTGKLASALLPP